MAVAVQVRERVGFHRDVYNSLVKCLIRQRKTGEFCDVMLRISNQVFYAHKAVLAAASPYFRTMFTARMKEQDSAEVDLTKSLQLDNDDSFRLVLDFMYSGDIEINVDNSEDILRIADFLLFEDVKEYCRQFFLVHGNLNLSNCLWISILSEHHNLKEVADVSRMMVGARFHDYFVHSEEILDLPEAIFSRLLKDRSMVRFTSSESLVLSIFRWIQHDSASRHQSLCRLMSCVVSDLSTDDCSRLLLQFQSAPPSSSSSALQSCPELPPQQTKMSNSLSYSSAATVAHNDFDMTDFYDDEFLDDTSEQVLIALNCNTAVKYFRFFVYNVPRRQWYILPVHSDIVLHMIPPRLSICSMILHDAMLFMFLSYNLPYPTDMLRINIMAFDIELGELMLLTFQNRAGTSGCCQTTLTDNRSVPPAMAHCVGCLCVVGNCEGVGQVFVCDPGSMTYTCYPLQGTRFVSLARVAVRDDRYLAIWCRHRFGHEEYSVNKEVSFAIFDVKSRAFLRPNLSAPPGISYSDFAEPHILGINEGRVVVHTPGKVSLILDESKAIWVTKEDAIPSFGGDRVLLEMPYHGYELYTFLEGAAYMFTNAATFITSLSCLSVGQPTGELHVPPPVDGISLVTSGYLVSSFFSALPCCERFDNSFAKLIHKKSKQLYDTDTEESGTGHSADNSSKEDNYEYDGYEYDDDIYGYFDDFEYERNVDML